MLLLCVILFFFLHFLFTMVTLSALKKAPINKIYCYCCCYWFVFSVMQLKHLFLQGQKGKSGARGASGYKGPPVSWMHSLIASVSALVRTPLQLSALL